MRQNSNAPFRRRAPRSAWRFFAAEEHLPEEAVDFLPRRVRVEAVQPFDRRQPLLDDARRILREVTDRYLVSPLRNARVHIAR